MNFKDAYKYTRQFEGGYVHDPDDAGGETFHGVSRVNWPGWAGWAIVDDMKRQKKNLNVLSEELARQVSDFYWANFWKPMEGLGAPDRATAKMFDTAVNVGVGRAIKFAQKILGAAVDGAVGPQTRAAAEKYFAKPGAENKFLAAYAAAQAAHYQAIVARKTSQGKFLKGWLRRAAWIPE